MNPSVFLGQKKPVFTQVVPKGYRVFRLWVFSLLPLLWCAPLSAASFDCEAARSHPDILVCSSPELSRLDEDVDRHYRRAVREARAPLQILREQRDWLRQRDACPNPDCLRQVYSQRLSALQAKTHFASPSAPPLVTGTYEFRDTGVLRVQQHGHDRLRFALTTRFGWDYGRIRGEAALVDQVAVFASPSDECGMEFRFGHERVQVTQTGVCGMQGQATANGLYFKLNAIPPGL
jgi:uncharacterized protein